MPSPRPPSASSPSCSTRRSRRRPGSPSTPCSRAWPDRHAPPAAQSQEAEPKRDAVLLAFLGVALITGASSFIYEVAWIRMLSLVLGSSTHSFELMLSAFILGLALGGLWIQRRIDRLASPVRALAILQVAMGVAALATLFAYGSTFDAMRWLLLHLARTGRGYALFNL